MFNNININKKNQLGLLETAQTNGGTECILECMSVTHTKPDYTMEDIYHFSSEERAGYTAYLEKKWADAVTRAQQEVMSWEMGEMYFSPTQHPDYEGEIERQVDLLRNLTSQTKNYDYTRIVNQGSYNVSMAGVFLGVLLPYPKEQETATFILEKIRWLVEHQRLDKGKPDSVGQITLNEDEDTFLLRKQIEHLDLDNCGKEQYYLLYALKDAWHSRHKPWAVDNSKFAVKIAPIINRASDAISKGLNRACKLIRKEKGGNECYPLDTLQAIHIDIRGKTQQFNEFDKWKERHSKIKQIMSQDIAKTSDEEKK